MKEVRAPRKILLVCLDNLGDLALGSALVSPLRAAFPEASVSIWAKDYAAGLLPFIPGLARTHACDPFWDRSPGAARGSLGRFLRTLREVSRERYDTVLLPNTHWRTAFAAWAAGIPRAVGFAQRGAGPWLSEAVAPERRDRPVVAEWSRLLSVVKAPAAAPVVHLEVPTSLQPARARMRGLLGPGAIVGIHPFAGDARREAPLAFWHEVLAGLPTLGVTKVLVVGRREESSDFVSRVGRPEGLGLLAAADVAPGGLEQVLLAVSLCGAFVGNDSGPLHCAAGLGVPVLGLYFPGDWPRAMPQGRGPWRAIRGAGPLAADAQAALGHIRELFKQPIE